MDDGLRTKLGPRQIGYRDILFFHLECLMVIVATQSNREVGGLHICGGCARHGEEVVDELDFVENLASMLDTARRELAEQV